MSIAVIGDAFIDLIVPAADIKPGNTYYRNVLTVCGGTANIAIWISRLGQSVKFLGKVGKDILGKYFKKDLVQNKVMDMVFWDNDHSTGLCVSLAYPDGERAMIARRGANDYLTEGEVESALGELQSSKIVCFSGYSFLSASTREAVLLAIRECHRAGCEIWFNPGAPNIINSSFLEEVISSFVHVLVLNVDEAKVLSGKIEIQAISRRLSQMCALSAVTLGGGGVIVIPAKGDIVHLPSPQVEKVVDTTGAGDAFAAGFAVGRMQGMNEVDSVQLGQETAAKLLNGRVNILKNET